MLIGIDASRANRAEKTGIEWYSCSLIQALKKITPTDESVRVILYTDKPLQEELAKLPANWEEKVLSWPFKFLWTQGRMSIEMLFNAPDALFMPASPLPIICPKKSFNTIHDIGFSHFPKYYPVLKKWYLKWTTWFAIKKAWGIFTPSEFTKQELIKYYKIDGKNITVTPLALIEENAVSGMGKILPPENYIIFVGRMVEKKNITKIINAFQEIKKENQESNLKLVLIGPMADIPPANYFISLPEWGSEIIYYPWLASEEVANLLRQAKALVFPSLYEGFGLPILEAFAAGTPVITSLGGATEEVAGTAALLVDPQSLAEIKAAVLKIISDENLRQGLIQKGKERVKNFSWGKCARETWERIILADKTR